MSLKTSLIAKLIFLVLAMVYTAEEKAKWVEWFIEEGKSFKQFGVGYRRVHGRHAEVPDKELIWDWYNKFKGQGSVERKSFFLFLLRSSKCDLYARWRPSSLVSSCAQMVGSEFSASMDRPRNFDFCSSLCPASVFA